ncbi:MAG TPA: YHS domain-containing protein [bacterium]
MAAESPSRPHAHATHTPTGFVDPVCGMNVKADTPHRAMHEGKEYGFCCDGCLTKFQADPAGVLAKAAARKPRATKAASLP